VCEYWLKPLWSHDVGLTFVSDTQSAHFAAALTLIVEREGAFVELTSPDRSIQIPCPTPLERVSANQFLDSVRMKFADVQNPPAA